jgi:hypothetical protein
MMLGGLPPKEEKQNIGATDSEVAILKTEIESLKKELKWIKWAVILLVIYAFYQQSKKK